MIKLKQIINIGLPIALGVFFVYYAYSKFTADQLDEMFGYFKTVNYFYIFLSLLFMLVSHASRAYRWRYSIQYLGYSSSFTNNFLAISVGYLLNMTVPRSGEVSRALVLQKYNDIPFDKGFGTIIAERIIDLVFLLFFVFLAFVLQYQQLVDFLSEKIPISQLIAVISALIVLGVLGIVMIYKSTLKIFVFIRTKISGLVEGVLSIFKMPHRIPFLVHTLIIWISFVLTFTLEPKFSQKPAKFL